MPCILKKPQDSSKGILIFTHKERPFLNTLYKYIQFIIKTLEKTIL